MQQAMRPARVSVGFCGFLARVKQGFRAACCPPAKRSAPACADAPCKGDDDAGFTLLGGATLPGSRKSVQSRP